MDFEKIFVSLDENHRKATISIILCSLILHSVFYASSTLYRDIEWYSQLLFSLGVSACYVATFTFMYIWLIKTDYVFYFSIPLLAFPAIFGFFPHLKQVPLILHLLHVPSDAVSLLPFSFLCSRKSKKCAIIKGRQKKKSVMTRFKTSSLLIWENENRSSIIFIHSVL